MKTPTESRHLQMEMVGEVRVVRLLTEHLGNQSTIDSVSKELYQLAELERHVLLDCSAVTLMTSMMLGRLIQLHKQLSSRGGKLVLCHLQSRVYHVFAITKLAKMFEIRKDRTDGLAAF